MRQATKSIQFKFKVSQVTKDASGECIIEGYANTSTKDRVGDVVLPKAFEKCLPTYLKNPVLLMNHDWNDVAGRVIHAEITDKGLFVKARVSDTRPDVKTLVKEGCLSTFSIGYNELDADMDEGTQTKIVKELELLEISIVSVPANTEAMFTQVAEKVPEPAEEQEPRDEEKPKGEEKGKSKSAGELKTFITAVKSVVGKDLGDTGIIAVIDYFNSNEEIMTKDELLKELRKSLPEPKAAKADEAAPADKPADGQAPSDDDAMKALMSKINAIAEALAQMMEKLDKLEQAEADEASEDQAEDSAEKPADEGKADDKPKDEEKPMKDDEEEKAENDVKPADKPGSAEDEKDKEDKDKEDMSAEDAEKAIADLDRELKELEDAENA